MLVDPIDRLLEYSISPDLRLGLLSNQISYSFSRNRYLVECLPGLKRAFLPEHGFFAELQDQIPIGSVSPYSDLADVDWVSLYGDKESSLLPDPAMLADIDLLVVDLQDVGARYYTFLTSVYYTMKIALTMKSPPVFCIVDRPNPAGRAVEGTPLEERFRSFVGIPGVLHKHGLTAAELLLYYREELANESGVRLKLCIIPFNSDIPIMDEMSAGRAVAEGRLPELQPPWMIHPSPNMPSPITPLVYAGQCLLEGTNLSEGRGTTRPFETCGAPYIDTGLMQSVRTELAQPDLLLRPLRFLPTFHKFNGVTCNGWQLHLLGTRYHSLLFTLDLIRCIKKRCPEFAWRTETYEYRDDLLAIEMLVGDTLLLDYLYGRTDRRDVMMSLHEAEAAWIFTVDDFLLYRREPLYSASQRL